jgi:hypothetical protein
MTMYNEVDALVSEIRQMLAGRTPGVQGAVLGDLVSMYLIGWPDVHREAVLAELMDLARKLMEPNEKLRFGERGNPNNTTGGHA